MRTAPALRQRRDERRHIMLALFYEHQMPLRQIARAAGLTTSGVKYGLQAHFAAHCSVCQQGGVMTTQDEDLEHLHDVLGRAVDTAENYMEYGTDATTPAMARLPADLRIDALSNALKQLRDTIKALYFELGGEDVWS